MAKVYSRRWLAAARKADSTWEADLRDGPLRELNYHTEKIPYVISHNYEPDFTSSDGTIIVEAKGRFRESSEAAKYKHIRNQLPEGRELVFLLYRASTPMPNAKPRKDGTKMTHGEWCERNKFTYFDNPIALRDYINEKEGRIQSDNSGES